MSLPLFDGCNYTLTRESPEMQLEVEEAVEGGLKVGWEMRVPEVGPDGAPFQIIFVGPTSEHRGTPIRLNVATKDGEKIPGDAEVVLETYYATGSERTVMYQGTYGQFAQIPDQQDPDAAIAAQKRAEAGSDYVIRLSVTVPANGPRPDLFADDTYFELGCVKLWWSESG